MKAGEKEASQGEDAAATFEPCPLSETPDKPNFTCCLHSPRRKVKQSASPVEVELPRSPGGGFSPLPRPVPLSSTFSHPRPRYGLDSARVMSPRLGLPAATGHPLLSWSGDTALVASAAVPPYPINENRSSTTHELALLLAKAESRCERYSRQLDDFQEQYALTSARLRQSEEDLET
ncbi:unnamed protein product [Vitrella brassicaformis CCMP3155]|uniref:Uncharacterized protein n=1 Tax=Vitrella brassicaformis (strain CCMP3155) TaxID=1169540 RepID=A0A0G4H2E9_VITBC|nr:unnamed protein product [Vitrella brassicaformis CCMP3155]|eukprot:CEM37649.1 unnamed protein product [Vitrella brassicaformis CCMP3155]